MPYQYAYIQPPMPFKIVGLLGQKGRPIRQGHREEISIAAKGMTKGDIIKIGTIYVII
jgi:hypothetical protein